MSNTEIYIYTKRRKSEILVGSASNSFSGAMAVWCALGEKYIISDFYPFKMENIKKVWALYKDKRLTRNERIVLTSTLDGSSCKPSGIKELVDALREVNHSLLKDAGNLSVQADLIEQAVAEHKDIYCVVILATDAVAFDDVCESKESTWDIIEDVNKAEVKYQLNTTDNNE